MPLQIAIRVFNGAQTKTDIETIFEAKDPSEN
jgi:hypothetical protein